MSNQPGGIVARALEFLRMADCPGWARFGAKTAVHALAHIDIEMRKLPLLGFLVHIDADRDTGDRTIALAGQATGADVEIHLENAAVAARQSFLDRHRN